MQWSAPALNPGLGLLYAPAVDWCGVFKKADELRYIPGHLYMGGSFTYDSIDKSTGWLTSLNAATGEVRWRYASSRPLVGAVTTTSADLVFTGEMTGDFIVLDGGSGEVAYRFNVGSPIPGGVLSYAVNGKQYSAVAAGGMAGFWSAPPGSAKIVVFALP
jgi:alcohol dehydrogenase (cytochrome c)